MRKDTDLLLIYEEIKRSLIGLRIDNRRREMKLSCPRLAKKLGMTRAELENCLMGKSEIYTDTLWYLSRILKTNVDYFFEDLNGLSVLQ